MCDDPPLELAMPVQVKAVDPFLRIRKKTSLTLKLELGKQSAVAIMEEEIPTPVQKKTSYKKRE